MTDYYKILGVSKKATLEEIKEAYRHKAQIHHPDKGGDQDKFQELNASYQELKDPEKRAHYDKHGMPLGKFQKAVEEILIMVVRSDMDDFILDPLDKLVKIEEDITKQSKNVKKKVVMLKDDIEKLSRKKNGDVSLVIQGLGRAMMIGENTLRLYESKALACEAVRKGFQKAKKLLKRKKENPEYEHRPVYVQYSTTGGTGSV